MTESSASASSVSDTHSPGAAHQLLGLDEDELHLWLCRRAEVTDSDTFRRSVLSRYAAVRPSDWQFTTSEHGKPHLAGAAPALEFNLSHSGDWLACAVARSAPLGVDLEYCDSRREVMKLARRFFCAEEVAALEARSAQDQKVRFYEFWTLKEAAVKARGEALPPGLQSRGFQLDSPLEPGRIAVNSSSIAEHAHYWLFDPLPGYRLALCSLAQSPQSPALRVYEFRDGNAIVERSIALRAQSCQN